METLYTDSDIAVSPEHQQVLDKFQTNLHPYM